MAQQSTTKDEAHCLLCKASIANAKQFMRMKFKQSIILKLSQVHIWSLGHDNSVLLTWSESPWQSKNPIRGISMRDWPAKPGQREKRLDGGPKRKSGPKNSKLSKQRNKKNYDSHHHIYYQILRHITEYNCQIRQYMVTFYYGIWESWIGFVWTLHTLWQCIDGRDCRG